MIKVKKGPAAYCRRALIFIFFRKIAAPAKGKWLAAQAERVCSNSATALTQTLRSFDSAQDDIKCSPTRPNYALARGNTRSVISAVLFFCHFDWSAPAARGMEKSQSPVAIRHYSNNTSARAITWRSLRFGRDDIARRCPHEVKYFRAYPNFEIFRLRSR